MGLLAVILRQRVEHEIVAPAAFSVDFRRISQDDLSRLRSYVRSSKAS